MEGKYCWINFNFIFNGWCWWMIGLVKKRKERKKMINSEVCWFLISPIFLSRRAIPMTSAHTHGYSNYMGGTIIETLSRVVCVWVCCLSGTNTIPSFICRWVCLSVMWWWLEGTTTIGFNPFDWLLLVPLVFIGGDGAAGRAARCSSFGSDPAGSPPTA